MMMFGGSPIRVAVPPMLDASTSAMRNGTGGSPSRSHTRKVTGAVSNTAVTLSSAAEASAVMTTKSTSIRNGLPRARLAAEIARNSNSPVCLITPTMIIMPSSRNTTFQSMPASTEWKAVSPSVRPSASISAAPPSAAATRCTRSVAMST